MARYTKQTVGTVPAINTELTNIQTAINDTLSRKGDSPNQMEALLDMNSNRIINLPEPVSGHEPLRLQDVAERIDPLVERAEDAAVRSEAAADRSETAADLAAQYASLIESIEMPQEESFLFSEADGDNNFTLSNIVINVLAPAIIGFRNGVLVKLGVEFSVVDANTVKVLHTLNLPDDEWVFFGSGFVDIPDLLGGSGAPVFDSFDQARSTNIKGRLCATRGYYSDQPGIGSGIYIKVVSGGSPGDTDNGSYFITPDGSRWELKHNGVLTASQFGIKGDGTAQSVRLNQLASALDPSISAYLDVSPVGVESPVLFNNGYKEVSSCSDFEAINLMPDLLIGTELPMFAVNHDENGIASNRVVAANVTGAVNKGSSTIPVDDSSVFEIGDVVCIGFVTCQITDKPSATTITVDRSMPYTRNNPDNSLTNYNTVDKLLQPNIGSKFSLGKVNGNGSKASPRYGYGLRVAHCFKATFENVHGNRIGSKVFQDTRCTDCVIQDISGVHFTDVTAGHGYVYRSAGGLDNNVYRVVGANHRHVVDFSFSHRCKAHQCKAFFGTVSADFLTHFNGCSYCDFIDCDLWYCSAGYASLSDPVAGVGEGADYRNRVIGGTCYNSRFSSRENDRGDDSTVFQNVRIVMKGSSASSAILVPGRDNTVFNFRGCVIETDKALLFGDNDCTINFNGGIYTNERNFGMGGEDRNKSVKFNFKDAEINVRLALTRRNPNDKHTYKNCVIKALVQPWQENAGDIEIHGGWCGYDESVTTGSRFWLPIQENDCTLADVTLSNIVNPYRFYTGTTAGTIRLGNNTLVNGSDYAPLSNLNWTNVGRLELTFTRSNGGTPLNGTEVHITDWDTTVGNVFMRKRVSGSWVDGKLTL